MTNPTKGRTVRTLIVTLTTLGGFAVVCAGIAVATWLILRRLDDPELVARLRQLNTTRAGSDEASIHALLDRIEASADHVRRDLNKTKGNQ